MNEALERTPVKGHRLFFEPELDNGNIALMNRSGSMVGSIWWAPKNKSTVEIETLHIDEFYQKRGLGEALLREFLKVLPQLYPQTKFLAGKATSQGIVRLLSKVLGEPVKEADTSGLPDLSPEDWRGTMNRVEVLFRVPQPVVESEDDDDTADFQRELRIANPEEAKKLLDQRFLFDEKNQMWKVLRYSDFTGSTMDRANGVYFVRNYPNVFSRDEGRFNEEIVGISLHVLQDLNPDLIMIILSELDRAKREPLDPELWKQLRAERQTETWNHWLGKNFASFLERKWPNQIDLVRPVLEHPSRLHALFEEARDAAGIEWIEHPGGEQDIDLDSVVNAVSLPMVLRWTRGRPQANMESLMEAREFSAVMAPAPPEMSDAVIRWGNMFVPEEDVYHDPNDVEGFGREDEVHVTVKFGLHEEQPSPELLRIIEETQPFEIEIGPCTLFENDKFDVVKFDVDGEGLRELNRRVSELPNSDKYPDYHPHMTVAYVNKGTCVELIGKPLFDPDLEPDARYVVKAVIFSGKNKEKSTLFLGKPNDITESESGEEFDQDLAKELHDHGQTFKNFTDADVDTAGWPTIYLDQSDLVDSPLWWHKQGLQKTASGYGSKIESRYKIVFNGRLYRIYHTVYGNAGSAWFLTKGRKIWIN